jgi:YD repeat-containing protein
MQLYLPNCLIIQTDPVSEGPNIKAYKEVLSAVALNLRVESPAVIEKLAGIEKSLILIIPKHSAQSLSPRQIQSALSLVENGAVLVSEGISPLTKQLGFRPGKTIAVSQLEEIAYPDVEIQWEKEEQVTILQPPEKSIVLNRESQSAEPIVCLLPRGRGNCLLLAAELNPQAGEAYARFPYFLQSLQRAGVAFPFRSERLSALFDYAYRLNENPDTLAEFWKETGIRALHVNAWNFYDGDQDAEAYLQKTIDACHRNGILVYAWLELPHVSIEFWQKHPKWREKTATGRDAHVDWRYGMNLLDPQCFQAVSEGLGKLIRQFDWDGVNLSELYFDTPAGKTSPEDFTPLNSIVRADFKQQTGIDPLDFFRKGSPNHWSKNAAGWKKFVDYRVKLEADLNERFVRLLSGFRNSSNSSLDVVVTYVDNIYDPSMREAVGADVGEMFGLLDKHDFTLVLEDPGTVWHLGPRRYAELAQTYSKLTAHTGRLGIDINIVDRDVKTYPTEKQTGTEFVELFCQAGLHFKTVMVYSESTLLPQDTSLVSAALASSVRGKTDGPGIRTQSPIAVVYRSGLMQADFEMDGNAWPCVHNGDVSLPAGSHFVSVADNQGKRHPHLIKLNGDLVSARYRDGTTIEFSYQSSSRSIAVFDAAPNSLQVDNEPAARITTAWTLLPRGSHKVIAAF